MADNKSQIEKISTALKDLVSALRDSVLFFLFILLLFFPGTVKDRLIAAGFTKGSFAGMEWEGQLKESAEQTKTVGEAVSKADENYQALIERLAELEKNVSDPTLKESINSIGDEARASKSDLAMADQALKRSLSYQQDMVQKITPQVIPNTGWLFLGKVTESKDEWVSGSPVTVVRVPALIAVGSQLTIRDDVYLRGDSTTAKHTDGAILSVVKMGESVTVTEVDYSHAKGGGWFVWVRVKSQL